MDWQKVRQSYQDKTRWGLLADLLDSAPTHPNEAQVANAGIRHEINAAGAENAVKLLEVYVQKQLAQVLKLPAEQIELMRPLGTLGVNSLMAIELRNRLEAGLGIALSATLVWNYPTISDMAPFLAKKMGISISEAQSATQAIKMQSNQSDLDETLDQTIRTVEDLTDDDALRQLLGND